MNRTKIVMAAFAALVTGTIIVVYAQWGNNAPTVLEANGQEVAQGAAVEKPQSPAASEAPKSQQPAPAPESDVPESSTAKQPPPAAPEPEAAGPSEPEVIYDFNRLPDPIRDTLQSIVVAAQTGNIEEMLPVLEENELKPMLSDTAVGDPIAFWKKASANGTGEDILAAMMNVFSTGFLRKGVGREAIYIWPYFAEMDLAKLTPAQDVDLYRLVPPPLGIEMKKSGKYSYYRAGIGADGVWHYFMK
jgi:hypothetical protein